MSDNILEKIIHPDGRGKIWRIFLVIVVLVVIAGLADAGSYYNRGADWMYARTDGTIRLPHVGELPFHLGLDLQGGSHLVYRADMSAIDAADRQSALEGVRDVIERRVNVFGVSEPLVQTTGSGNDYRIIVELAGIKDVNEAIKMIGETPLLEFKEQADQARTLTPDEQSQLDQYNADAEKTAHDVLGKALSGGDFAALAKQYSQDANTKDNGGDLGWITEKDAPDIVSDISGLNPGEVRSDLVREDNGYDILKLVDKREKTNPFDNNEPEMEVKAAHILICYEGAANCSSGLTKDEAYAKIEALKKIATPQNFAQLAKENSTEPGADQSGGELGWFGRSDMVKPFADEVFSQKTGTISDPVETEFGYHLIYKEGERPITEYEVSRIFIGTASASDITGDQKDWKNTELTGKNLKHASVTFNPNDNTPQVSLEFDDEGAKLFEDITARNVGKPVAIFLDGYPISTPTVDEKITGGKAVISGHFTINEAKLLAQRLNAGALPVPITLISQETVGASLGKSSLDMSLRAGIFGLILVVLFMILYYRLPGLLSVFSLLIYGLLALATFKALPIWLAFIVAILIMALMFNTFGELKAMTTFLMILFVAIGIILVYFAQISVTLTLAGLAGFILSIGMAVDANVLIFERLREELGEGKPAGLAVDEAFRRAWPSIRDGNLSTMITCLILIGFGTGAVQGFGTTLLIGITISMFSAIVVTRNFMLLLPADWLEKKLWLVNAKSRQG